MNCKEVAEFLSDYLDGTLPLRQRLIFKLHLLLCRDCRNYLASFAETIRLATSQRPMPGADGAPPIPEPLVQAILAARRSEGPLSP
jgi:predicted anti-sigma-YlaC factor YlaD